MNECTTSFPCDPGAACFDTVGSYTCSCPHEADYPETAGGSNANINNCNSGFYGHSSRFCQNDGSWGVIMDFCLNCTSGLTSNFGSTRADQCYLESIGMCDTATCDVFAICNELGTGSSYFCSCPEDSGFWETAGGTEAVPASICPAGQYGRSERFCYDNGTWGEIDYICSDCPLGYSTLEGSPYIQDCTLNVNECSSGPNPCPNGAVCVDTYGSYNCSCPAESGFPQTLAGQDAKVALCPRGQYGLTTRPCNSDATWGTYTVSCQYCPIGYTSNPNSAKLSDCFFVGFACTSNPCQSNPLTFCVDTIESYDCICFAGYDEVLGNCTPNARTQFLSEYNPIARYLFDGRLDDSTGNGHSISVISDNSQYSFAPNFYQRGSSNNQALETKFNFKRVITSSIAIDGSLTIEVIFNMKEKTSFVDLIAVLPTPTTSLYGALLKVSTTSNLQIQWSKPGLGLGKSKKVLRIGQTHSLVVNIRNGKIVTYIDNLKLGTFNFLINPGSYYFVFGSSLKGYLDEIGLYNINIFNPPGNSINQLTECINICGPGEVCVNTATGFECVPAYN